ncbi:hypothetical protein HN958_02765 [Candidatus Falkowbacteria bacterium]|jgi:hypothetical protein|nr:hypothetical protein [Candidatus Falkowbacteria bacterium]MBT7007402.1 hypothetical protein [Candidatus Falkowbacteria bacterium]
MNVSVINSNRQEFTGDADLKGIDNDQFEITLKTANGERKFSHLDASLITVNAKSLKKDHRLLKLARERNPQTVPGHSGFFVQLSPRTNLRFPNIKPERVGLT